MGKNISIPNASFEQGDQGWTRNQVEGEYRLDIDTKVAHSGRNSARIVTVRGGWARWIGELKLEAGKVYRVSAYAKGINAFPVSLWVYGCGNDEKNNVRVGESWERLTLEFVSQQSGTAALFLQISPRCTGWKGATVWFDDVTLENISASRPAIKVQGTYVLSQPRNEKADPPLAPALKAENASMGYLLYRREDPRFFYPNSIPQPAELLTKGIKTTAARRQAFAAAWFMIHALDEVKDLHVSLTGDLTAAGGGVISKSNVEVKLIQFWKQRPGLCEAKYYEIPELLVPGVPVCLSKGENQGLWIQVRLPKTVQAGTYTAGLVCRMAGRTAEKVPFTLEVLPFDLETPKDIHWVNYQNDERWDSMSDEAVRRDIQSARDYGIDGMILEVFKGKGLSLTRDAQGKIQFESRRVGLYQKYRKELGMTGPLAIAPEKYLESWAGGLAGLSVNGQDPNMSGLMNSPVLQKAFKDSIQAIDRFVKSKGGPGCGDWYYYGTDEPFAGNMQKSIWENRLARAAGAKTASTCYPEADLKKLLPYLSADITHETDTPELARRRRELVHPAHCEYWFLGAGSYEYQEGGLMPNRYLAGFLLYKSGATASVHWTFVRPNGDPYNDFDGTPPQEFKDICIAYPAVKSSAKETLVSTLQWEGIREGVDDYKYVHTLDGWIRRAKDKGLTEAADQAQKARDKILKDIPWGKDFNPGNCLARPGTYNNASADQSRRALAAEIVKLKEVISKK